MNTLQKQRKQYAYSSIRPAIRRNIYKRIIARIEKAMASGENDCLFVCNMLHAEYKRVLKSGLCSISFDYPEFYAQKPEAELSLNDGWWRETKRGNLARIAALRRAIELVEKRYNLKP